MTNDRSANIQSRPVTAPFWRQRHVGVTYADYYFFLVFFALSQFWEMSHQCFVAWTYPFIDTVYITHCIRPIYDILEKQRCSSLLFVPSLWLHSFIQNAACSYTLYIVYYHILPSPYTCVNIKTWNDRQNELFIFFVSPNSSHQGWLAQWLRQMTWPTKNHERVW